MTRDVETVAFFQHPRVVQLYDVQRLVTGLRLEQPFAVRRRDAGTTICDQIVHDVAQQLSVG